MLHELGLDHVKILAKVRSPIWHTHACACMMAWL